MRKGIRRGIILLVIILIFLPVTASARATEESTPCTIELLTFICDIPIYYITTDEMREQRDLYGLDFLPAGLCFTDKILIHDIYRGNLFCLAHEIAHHLDWGLDEPETDELAKQLIKGGER